MIEFPPFLIKPLVEIAQPILTRFSAPFMRSWEDISGPVKQLRSNNFTNRDQLQKIWGKLVKNAIRVTLTVIVFFIYQASWHNGTHYFGRIGAISALYLSMSAVCHIDPKIFYMANSGWFFYKGLGILRGIEDGRLLCLLLIYQKHFDDRDEGLFKYEPIKLVSQGLASWMTNLTYNRPATSNTETSGLPTNSPPPDN